MANINFFCYLRWDLATQKSSLFPSVPGKGLVCSVVSCSHNSFYGSLTTGPVDPDLFDTYQFYFENEGGIGGDRP